MVLDRIQKCLPFLPLKKSSKFGNYSIAFEGMPRHPNQKESKEIRKSWRKIELDAAKLGIQVFVGLVFSFLVGDHGSRTRREIVSTSLAWIAVSCK